MQLRYLLLLIIKLMLIENSITTKLNASMINVHMDNPLFTKDFIQNKKIDEIMFAEDSLIPYFEIKPKMKRQVSLSAGVETTEEASGMTDTVTTVSITTSQPLVVTPTVTVLLKLELFEPSTLLCTVLNKQLDAFKRRFNSIIYSVITRSPFLANIVNNIQMTTIKPDLNNLAFPLSSCQTRDIFDNVQKDCAIIDENYNQKLCWQAFEVEYEVSYRTSCTSDYFKQEECEQYFSNDNKYENSTITSEIIGRLLAETSTASIKNFIQVLLKAQNTTESLYLNISFLGKQCLLLNGAIDTECVARETGIILNETKLKLRDITPTFKDKCEIFSNLCSKTENQVCINDKNGARCECRQGLYSNELENTCASAEKLYCKLTCKNEGRCVLLLSLNDYKCACYGFYFGDSCQYNGLAITIIAIILIVISSLSCILTWLFFYTRKKTELTHFNTVTQSDETYWDKVFATNTHPSDRETGAINPAYISHANRSSTIRTTSGRRLRTIEEAIDEPMVLYSEYSQEPWLTWSFYDEVDDNDYSLFTYF